ncbi:MAG: L,D-transpeptidase [Chloroflexota bacterium]
MGRRLRRLFSIGALAGLALSLTVSFSADAQDAGIAAAGLSTAEILAYLEPNVTQLYPDDQLLYDRVYEKVLEAVEVFDAPGGAVVDTLDAGFNYITVKNSADAWTQIDENRWVLSVKLRQVLPSTYAGILLPSDLPYPVAWVLDNVVPSATPGTEPIDGTLALLRYTTLNLYATVVVDGWEWYQVGVGQWVEQRKVARVLPVERSAEIDTEKWVSVDLYEQVAIAYEGSTPVFATLVASGLGDWPTNEGLFHVYVRYPRTVMSGANGNPDFYYLQEVPWTMYFDHDIGLHGTYWHDGFGYRHSHGCVNLSITDAHWLYNWASSEIDLSVSNDTGAAVYVYSSGAYR